MDVLELMCALEQHPGLFGWLVSSSSELLSADVNLCVPVCAWAKMANVDWWGLAAGLTATGMVHVHLCVDLWCTDSSITSPQS